MYVHGHNLEQKEKHRTKYTDETSRKYLKEIREEYNKWRENNIKLIGPTSVSSTRDIDIITERVNLFQSYKDFIDQQHYAEKFDSRSNLHSSVLEEFIYYLFKDLVADFSSNALIGKARAFKDLFFQAPDYQHMVKEPYANIEIKDHDFVIGVNIETVMSCSGYSKKQKSLIQVPAVAIECKTYLDKTMLEGASTAGQQLLIRNPNAIYIVVAEWLKLTEKVNLKKFKVDQIFVLRKQKNTDREFRYADSYIKNPIYPDVVIKLFEMVRNHLTTPWAGTIQEGLDRGYLI